MKNDHVVYNFYTICIICCGHKFHLFEREICAESEAQRMQWEKIVALSYREGMWIIKHRDQRGDQVLSIQGSSWRDEGKGKGDY